MIEDNIENHVKNNRFKRPSTSKPSGSFQGSSAMNKSAGV